MRTKSQENRIGVRFARPHEAARLSSVARDAKASWGYPEAWLHQWAEELTITRPYIEQHAVWVAEEKQDLLGFTAVEQANDHMALAHLWVRPVHHGRGVGRRLVTTAAEYAARAGHRSLEVVSDPNAAEFYEHLGARQRGWADASFEGVNRRLPVFCIPVPGLVIPPTVPR